MTRIILIILIQMNSNDNLGKTVIDELRLCYLADNNLLQDLRNIEYGEKAEFETFTLLKIDCQYFKTCFNVYCVSDNIKELVATLKFDRYGDEEDSSFVYFRVENHILYDSDKLCQVLKIPEALSLLLNNITAIDLARDFRKNICNTIRRIYKDKAITTIINGKAIKDRQHIIPNMSVIYASTLDRLKNPSLYIKQAKAIHDKTKGITVCAYDKVAEIQNASEKQYVLDFYGNPKRLHRLEVHLNSSEVREFCNNRRIVQTTDLLFNQDFLTEMYLYHLSAVLRFTKGRNKVSWEDIFNNGRVI